MSEVTRILSAIEQGDSRAAEQLLPLVYDELRRLAAQKLARESPGQTLQATALVHEAYLRLVGSSSEASTSAWNSRGHFFAAAAEAMRRILVEQARHKQTVKAGGDRQRIELTNNIEPAVPEPDVDLLALHDALDRLEAADKRKAELVKLRFFVGLTIEEAAQALGVSVSTATTDWAYARCWLRLEVLGVRDLKAT
jgi:RNA polymerase sigma factor (TIGR02999 family)